jgi:hypothetical protein
VANGLRSVFGQLADARSPAISESEYPRVAYVFNHAERLWDDASAVDRLLEMVLGFDERLWHSKDVSIIVSQREQRLVLAGDVILPSKLGKLLVVRELMRAFRAGVFSFLGWMGAINRRGEWITDWDEVLLMLCRAFDRTVSHSGEEDLGELLWRTSQELREGLRRADAVGAMVSEPGLTDLDLGGREALARRAGDAVRDLGRQVWEAGREEIRLMSRERG